MITKASPLQQSSLDVTGQIIKNTSSPVPRYQIPGLTGDAMGLMDLVSKPLRIDKFIIDNTFAMKEYDVTANILTYFGGTLLEQYLKFHMYPLFDVEITFQITGHQFFIAYLGAWYDPLAYNDGPILTNLSSAPADLDIGFYNECLSMEGVFSRISDGSSMMQVICNLPRSTSYHDKLPTNAADPTVPQYFGTVKIAPIVPCRSTKTPTVNCNVFMRLTNVRLAPWQT